MIKHSGLGQLADVAKELTDPAGGHYPVRRRGERRELHPNWAGIAWLEAQTLKHTDLLGSHPVYDGDDSKPIWYTHPAARLADRTSEGVPTHCTRPMIELIDDYHVREELMSGAQYSIPCPRCDDWSRTARCTEHAERGAGAVTSPPPAVPDHPHRWAAPHFLTDADGVLHAQQGDPYDAARDLVQAFRDEFQRRPDPDHFRIFLGGGA